VDTNNNSGGRGARPFPPARPIDAGLSQRRAQSQELQVVASGPVARELEPYTDWASGIHMMPEDQVLARVIDHALTECFRSDEKWRREKAEFRGGPSPPATVRRRRAGGQGDGAGRHRKTGRTRRRVAGAGGEGELTVKRGLSFAAPTAFRVLAFAFSGTSQSGPTALHPEESSSRTTADATFTTVQFALRDLFRRDRVWRERRHTSASRPSVAAPASATERSPASSPPSLPPPSPRDPGMTT
jgi:hypothetical protein